jgi:type 2 lantibiotic biosynthesis protein LanM
MELGTSTGAGTSSPCSGEAQGIESAPPQSAHDVTGFLALFAPQIDAARARLQQWVEAQGLQAPCFDPAGVVELLYAGLPAPLLAMVERTLVLELHVARMLGLLQGETPAEHYRSFIQRLRDPEVAQSLLDEYSVLAEQVEIRLDNWVAFGLTFLRDLAADWPRLAGIFGLGANDQLERVQTGAGDPHRGGRTVTIVHFRSGVRLVYRPSSVAAAIHFQDLLAWCNARGAEPPFRTLKILDCGDHGWVEFVSPADCSCDAQVTHFYRRQGGYLALFHALAGTDFHMENLIAQGEHPVFVDLEALFHQPRLALSDSGPDRLLESSVLAVGLLPSGALADGPLSEMDVSGLTAAAGSRTPQEVPCWQGDADEMHPGQRRAELPAGRHRPTLQGKPVNPLDYLDALADGFTAVYRLLCRHRDELLAGGGPLSWFAADETRYITRPTLAYAVLLQHGYHPDRLRARKDRDALLDRLGAVAVRFPRMARLLAAERADLNRGDIPLFTTRPGSRELVDSRGGRQVDFFDCTGLDLVRQRLTEMSEDDLGRQLWIIRASFANLDAERNSKDPVAVAAAEKDLPPAPTPADVSAKLRSAACAVGDRLAAMAWSKGAETIWFALSESGPGRGSLAPVGLDLYDGLPGIALFLSYLATLEGEERFGRLAESALATFRNRLEETRPSDLPIGAFTGWGGAIHALTQIGLLTNQPELLRQAEDILAHLPPLIDQDRNFDVISGAAGCLVSLLRLHQATQSERALVLAVRCGDHLLAHAEAQAHGIAWTTPAPGAAPLTGFSHGAAGVAWALLELAAASGAERFRSAAQAALAYERSLFCPQAGNWLDLRARPAGDGPNFAFSWCHGAPGIGLARLHALRLLEDPVLRTEIDAALQTTCTHGFGGYHTLCCGDLGNLELLLQADSVLADPRWRRELDRQTARIVGAATWRCASPGGLLSPGLMTGLAGIGYGLLRLARPDQVPSVLTLGALGQPGG